MNQLQPLPNRDSKCFVEMAFSHQFLRNHQTQTLYASPPFAICCQFILYNIYSILSPVFRYDLSGDDSSDHVVSICCYEAKRLFRDRIVGVESRETFDSILQGIFRSDWNTTVFDSKEGWFTSKLSHNVHTMDKSLSVSVAGALMECFLMNQNNGLCKLKWQQSCFIG